MQQPQQNYEYPALKKAFLKSSQAPKDKEERPNYYACEAILDAFEKNNPSLYIQAIRDARYRQAVMNLAAELPKDYHCGTHAATTLLRQEESYKEFEVIWRNFSFLDQVDYLMPYLQPQTTHSSCFNWKSKLLLFAIPPVGVIGAYTGAAIGDAVSSDNVKAVNDFFVANAGAVSAALTIYYLALFVACVVQYCRQRHSNDEESNFDILKIGLSDAEKANLTQ